MLWDLDTIFTNFTNTFDDKNSENITANHNNWIKLIFGSDNLTDSAVNSINFTTFSLDSFNWTNYFADVSSWTNLDSDNSTDAQIIPDTIDWRDFGAVTPVKNQGSCKASWAFSAVSTALKSYVSFLIGQITDCVSWCLRVLVQWESAMFIVQFGNSPMLIVLYILQIGALEGQYFLNTGILVKLSEQYLIDCSRKFSNLGCKGGATYWAFDYLKHNHGVPKEYFYSYKGIVSIHIVTLSMLTKFDSFVKMPNHLQDGKCRKKKPSSGTAISNYVDVLEGDEEELRKAVGTVGPVSVAFNVLGSLASYKDGKLVFSGVLAWYLVCVYYNELL